MRNKYFFDMDGCLTEWKNLNITIAQTEDITLYKEKIYNILRQKGYYLNLKPHNNVVNLANQLISKKSEDVYVLSCYIPNSPCLLEKVEWLENYLPNLDKNNIIFVPDGMGDFKHNYIPMNFIAKEDLEFRDENDKLYCICKKGQTIEYSQNTLPLSIKDKVEPIEENYILIDDHTPNCTAWEQYDNSTAIKLMNDVNGKNGNWKGNILFFDDRNIGDKFYKIEEEINNRPTSIEELEKELQEY